MGPTRARAQYIQVHRPLPWPMDDEGQVSWKPAVPQIFQAELMEQCNAATVAYAELRTLASKHPPADMEGRIFWSRRVWSRVQAILAANAAINRILWPSPDKYRGEAACSRSRQRGWSVRAAMEIRDERPTVGGHVYKALERFDEVLDDVQVKSPDDKRLGWLISRGTTDEEALAAKGALRYYGVNSNIVQVGDETCNLLEVVSWVEGLMDFIKYSGGFVDSIPNNPQ